VTGAPGLDLPGLDCAAIAAVYGVPSRQVAARDELRDALAEAIGSDGPQLVEVPVAPGMSLA
jgi:benzoylformate decarboxylase